MRGDESVVVGAPQAVQNLASGETSFPHFVQKGIPYTVIIEVKLPTYRMRFDQGKSDALPGKTSDSNNSWQQLARIRARQGFEFVLQKDG